MRVQTKGIHCQFSCKKNNNKFILKQKQQHIQGSELLFQCKFLNVLCVNLLFVYRPTSINTRFTTFFPNLFCLLRILLSPSPLRAGLVYIRHFWLRITSGTGPCGVSLSSGTSCMGSADKNECCHEQLGVPAWHAFMRCKRFFSFEEWHFSEKHRLLLHEARSKLTKSSSRNVRPIPWKHQSYIIHCTT